MATPSPSPRMAGLALRAVSAAAAVPGVGPAVTANVLAELGLQALRDLELPLDAPAPALVLRPLRVTEQK